LNGVSTCMLTKALRGKGGQKLANAPLGATKEGEIHGHVTLVVNNVTVARKVSSKLSVKRRNRRVFCSNDI